MSYKFNPFTQKLDYYEPPPQDLDTTDSPTFADLTLSGELFVGENANTILETQVFS